MSQSLHPEPTLYSEPQQAANADQKVQLGAEISDAIRLSLPMAAAQLATIALQVTDHVLCGRLGANALAGVGLGSAAYSMLFYPVMAIVQAISPLVAHAHGAQDQTAIRGSLQHALVIACVLGLLCIAVMGQIGPILRWMGQPAELISVAEDYVMVLRWAALPGLIVTALRGFLDSHAMPRLGLIVGLSGIVVNFIGNWLLIFGNGGFPALGVAGSGWATFSVNLWMAVCLAAFVLLEPRFKPYQLLQGWKLSLSAFKEHLRLGLPMALTITAEVWLFTGMSLFMGWLGTAEVAAHQVALGAASTTFMIALGIANASTVRVGNAMGRQNYAEARRAGWISVGLGLCCMSLTALMFWFVPRMVVGVYLNLQDPGNAQVIEMAVLLLHYAALFQLFDALQVTCQGSLRGLKDTFAPMWIGFCSYWGVGLGSGLLFGFGLKWGAAGLWLGLVMGLMAAGLALAGRFYLKTTQLVKQGL